MSRLANILVSVTLLFFLQISLSNTRLPFRQTNRTITNHSRSVEKRPFGKESGIRQLNRSFAYFRRDTYPRLSRFEWVLDFQPERTFEQMYPNAKYLDPCKANGFIGDVALSDDELSGMILRYGKVNDAPVQNWKEHVVTKNDELKRQEKQTQDVEEQVDNYQSDSSGKPTSHAFDIKTLKEYRKQNERNKSPNRSPLFLSQTNVYRPEMLRNRQGQQPALPPVPIGDPATSQNNRNRKVLTPQERRRRRQMRRFHRQNVVNDTSIQQLPMTRGDATGGNKKQTQSLEFDKFLQKHQKLMRRQEKLHRKLMNLSRRQAIISERMLHSQLPSKPTRAYLERSQRSAVSDIDQSQDSFRVEIPGETIVPQSDEDAPRRRHRRAATAYKSRTWPYGVIPYVIQANFSTTIMKAMRHWENHTCLSFVEREPQHKSYIIFTVKPCGCCSYVGRRSEDEPQAISIGKNCDKKGIVIHELGHVIGFWHEHTRPDRDDHVEILLENVVDGQDFNFKKMDSGEVNSLREPYDYSSIMHYAKGTFAKANKDETIRPKACCPRPPIGQRIQLSPGDVRQTNKLYGCPSCGRTLLESSGIFASPQMSWAVANADYSSSTVPDIDFDSLDILTDPSSFYHPLTDELTNHRFSGMVGDERRSTGEEKSDGDIMMSDEHWKVVGKTNVEKPFLNEHRLSSLQGRSTAAMRNHASSLGFSSAGPLFCQWRITVAMGERIYLNFTYLDVFSPTSLQQADDVHKSGLSMGGRSVSAQAACTNDYVEVRDGYYSGSPLIGRYCEKKLPPTLVSSKSRLWIEYRRSLGSLSSGFVAEYQAICGGEVVQEEGLITSPSYPELYKSNKECIWKIVVPMGFSVALTFQSFEIEKHDNCVYDYLEIRDGLSDNSPMLKKLCGSNLPTPIKSTNNMMYIKFISDSSVEKQGFTAKFQKEFDECKTTNHGCSHICVNTLGGYRCQCEIGYELHPDGKRCEDACGGVINAANGTIQTPGFPADYPPNKNCIWKIVAVPKSTIFLNFTSFNLEGKNKNCNYDFINVYSGPQHNQQKIGTFCGNSLPSPITSHTNELSIEFYTDGSVQRTGFKAVFFTDLDECADNNGGCQHICRNTIGSYYCECRSGFKVYGRFNCKEIGISAGCQQEISAPEGEIRTPNWPSDYPARQSCEWKITATPGHRVKIVFDSFEVESHQQCMYDRVIAYDGLTTDESQIGRFCGSRKPPPIVSTHGNLLLTFNADGSVQRKGFRAQHSTVCGGELKAELTPKNLFSHAKFGDLDYPVNQQCYWTITSSMKNYTILLRFLFLEVEEETLCTYDFVKIFDGPDSSSQRLGEYCGRKLVPEVYAESGSMHIQFLTDDTISGKGFHVQYLLIPDSAAVHHLNSVVKMPGVAYQRPGEMIQQYQQPAYSQRLTTSAPIAIPSWRFRKPYNRASALRQVPFNTNRYVSRVHASIPPIAAPPSPWISPKTLYKPPSTPDRRQRSHYRSPYIPRTQNHIYNPHGTWRKSASSSSSSASSLSYRERYKQLRPDVEYGVHEVGVVTSSYIPAIVKQNYRGVAQSYQDTGVRTQRSPHVYP